MCKLHFIKKKIKPQINAESFKRTDALYMFFISTILKNLY